MILPIGIAIVSLVHTFWALENEIQRDKLILKTIKAKTDEIH